MEWVGNHHQLHTQTQRNSKMKRTHAFAYCEMKTETLKHTPELLETKTRKQENKKNHLQTK